jgi:hypothetical protein
MKMHVREGWQIKTVCYRDGPEQGTLVFYNLQFYQVQMDRFTVTPKKHS